MALDGEQHLRVVHAKLLARDVRSNTRMQQYGRVTFGRADRHVVTPSVIEELILCPHACDVMKHSRDARLVRRDAVAAREALCSPSDPEHVAKAFLGKVRPDRLTEVKELASTGGTKRLRGRGLPQERLSFRV